MSRLLILLVRFYQVVLNPPLRWIFGNNICRFEPSCSHYMIQAIQKYGPFRGVPKGLWRLCRCNPFCEGGHDPP
jgi:putative membrane protein insertion efficiency factor